MSTSPKPVKPTKSAGIKAINAIPIRRKSKRNLSPAELKALDSLLGDFLASANNRAAPKKEELFLAVQAMLKRGSRSLSRQWDKTQLALALFRWIHEAKKLGPQHSQKDLTILINHDNNDPGLLGHTIYLYDEVADETETFAIQTPSQAPQSDGTGASPISLSNSTALSRSELNSPPFGDSLLVDLEGLASFDSLAAIPTEFTPRAPALPWDDPAGAPVPSAG